MITRDLLSFIEKRRSSKITDDAIETELQSAGWKAQDIEFALSSNINKDVPLPPYENENIFDKKSHESRWDMFLNILMFISMYISIFASIDIFFKIINSLFPEHSRYGYYPLWDVEGPLSALIVSFPIFVYLFKKVEKLAREKSWIKTVTTRAPAVYLTLIIAFVSFIVTAISAVNVLLGGNFTLNFLLKIAVIISYSYMIFTYFIREIRENQEPEKPANNLPQV